MADNEFGVDLPDVATSTDPTKEITVQADVVEAGENTTVKLTITKPKEALGTDDDGIEYSAIGIHDGEDITEIEEDTIEVLD